MTKADYQTKLAEERRRTQAMELAEACRLCGIGEREAASRSRERTIIHRKKIVAWLLKRKCGWTNNEVGQALGGLTVRQVQGMTRDK